MKSRGYSISVMGTARACSTVRASSSTPNPGWSGKLQCPSCISTSGTASLERRKEGKKSWWKNSA